jgi:hypothetical protein
MEYLGSEKKELSPYTRSFPLRGHIKVIDRPWQGRWFGHKHAVIFAFAGKHLVSCKWLETIAFHAACANRILRAERALLLKLLCPPQLFDDIGLPPSLTKINCNHV